MQKRNSSPASISRILSAPVADLFRPRRRLSMLLTATARARDNPKFAHHFTEIVSVWVVPGELTIGAHLAPRSTDPAEAAAEVRRCAKIERRQSASRHARESGYPGQPPCP